MRRLEPSQHQSLNLYVEVEREVKREAKRGIHRLRALRARQRAYTHSCLEVHLLRVKSYCGPCKKPYSDYSRSSRHGEVEPDTVSYVGVLSFRY